MLVFYIVVIGYFIGNIEDNETKIAEQLANNSYYEISVDEMLNALYTNALATEEVLDGAYVEITGKLSVIDSDGKYISLSSSRTTLFSFQNVTCYLKLDSHLEQVGGMSIGDIVVIKGKITDVGEVIGFKLDIHEILD